MPHPLSTYTALHSHFPPAQPRPVVGITGNFGDKGCELAEGYYESVVRAGAAPLVIPPTADPDTLIAILDSIDALILSGGGDINPLYLGEEPLPQLHGINPRRDDSELLLLRLALDRQLPMLGICRGIQVLAAVLGGRLYQDIATQHKPGASTLDDPFLVQQQSAVLSSRDGFATLIKHSQDLDRAYPSHTVRLAEGSLLQGIFATDTDGEAPTTLQVNSFHHQAVAAPGQHLRVSAIAPDGVIEAVESTEGKSILGVQWHPECFCLRGDDSMLPLFRWLAAEAASYAEARCFHRTHLTFDSHCDTPMFFDKGILFDTRDPQILVDLHKMTEGGLDATTMVAYIPQGPLTDAGRDAAYALAESRLDGIDRLAEHPCVAIARHPDELPRIKAEGRKAIMKGIENGYAIGLDISRLDHFASRGIIYMTLCHNGNNDICGSARPREGEPRMGFTDFGAKVVGRMNELGILVDMSHAGTDSFYDALELSTTPIVCSHSSAKALCDHPRNLDDDQLRALARRGGVAQVTFYDGFLRRGGGACIDDAVAHIMHMARVMGVEHIGIGTDFDGDGGVPGLASAAELINLTRRLQRHFSPTDLQAIWGGNFLRLLSEVRKSVNR